MLEGGDEHPGFREHVALEGRLGEPFPCFDERQGRVSTRQLDEGRLREPGWGADLGGTGRQALVGNGVEGCHGDTCLLARLSAPRTRFRRCLPWSMPPSAARRASSDNGERTAR